MYCIGKDNFVPSLVCRPVPSDPKNPALLYMPKNLKAHPKPHFLSKQLFNLTGFATTLTVVTNCTQETHQDFLNTFSE